MANGKKKRGFIRYRSYMFVDKDPIIDCIRTARSEKKLSYTQLHEKSDVAVATVRNWEHGKTRSPMFKTVMAVINAMGKKLGSRGGKPFLHD